MMADNLLDDLTLEDVQKANIEDEIINTLASNKNKFHIQLLDSLFECKRGKDILRFALVRVWKNEKYDIRVWYEDGERPGRGFLIGKEEILVIREAFREFDFSKGQFRERARYKSDKVNAVLYDKICLLSEFYIKGTKWIREIAVVDFGYGKKIDFRKWKDDYSVCGKGISITFQEAKIICDLLKNI